MASEKIKSLIKQIPSKPGVYFHKDKNGKIIYVGKAARLNQRVRQYFQASRGRDPKTEVLVKSISTVDWIETETELDALFLESELIKRYKPRFNIELRDDKSQLYVRINMKDKYPSVGYTRRPLDDGAQYFGPYYNGATIKRAMKYLRRIFPFSTHEHMPKRVCLQYHIGLCPGVEEEKISSELYKQNLRKLISYLKGNRIQLINQVEKEMTEAANNRDFELATSLRNQLMSLKSLRQQIVFSDREFMDISKDQGLSGLQDLLDLKGIPRRIEGYDISHMSGGQTVASMVVFTNGIPDKTEYRKFKLKIPGNDDFAHMKEVLSRRFSGRHLNWEKPDLILIDGGKGQLSSALTILNEKSIAIPAIGLAKRREQIIVSKSDKLEAIELGLHSHVTKLLQRIRDESHRFALSYHSVLKTKRQTTSLLEDIPTIGPATRKKLFKTFGSLQGIRQARHQELESVIGKKKATILRQYLRSSNKNQRAV